MPTSLRRRTSVIAALGLSLVLVSAAAAAATVAQDTDVEALGTQLVDEFIEILKLPDEAKRVGLEGFLANEFQIVRDSGARLDQAGYIENPATVFEVEISELKASEDGGVLVVSYTLAVDEVIDGVAIKSIRSRLSVFHLGEDGRWRIAAHANFGALPENG